MQSYSENCDYLLKRFKLGNETSIYVLIKHITDFIKDIDSKEQENSKKQPEEKSVEIESIENISIPKEKKRGRPKKHQ